ncbi:MAG: flagellar export chaperone FlgN [Clostridia bacterium]|jgi:hypothetical protein
MKTKREVTAELTKLLEIKKEKLEYILQLTREQGAAIDRGDLEWLSKMIELKENAIREIDGLDARFSQSCKGLYEENLSVPWLQVEDGVDDSWKALRMEISQINGILEKIRILDDANRRNANKWMGALKEKIRSVKQGQKGIGAYKGSIPKDISVFMDYKE